MTRHVWAIAAGLCLAATSVLAQPAGVTKDEVKCEAGTGKALSKFVGSKGKCGQKCISLARKTSGPYAGCFAPYADPTTNTCIMDPVKGAEAKARASIMKACSVDCPECYPASECSTGEPFVSNTESLVDLQGPNVYCTENGGNTPSKTDAKCEDTVAKTLAKFVAAKGKCYTKCDQNAFKGTVTQASCQPPASDPPTASCISLAEGKSAASIDKACVTPPATEPSCYDGSAFRPNTGAGWTALVEGVVDSQVPIIGCGSPSGAFVE